MFPCAQEPESDGEEVVDDDATRLSYVGEAAYEVLRKKHNEHHHSCWNVTSGQVVGEVHQTPLGTWNNPADMPPTHDQALPQKMAEVLSRTEYWADVTSLSPPDDIWMSELKKAMRQVAQNSTKRSPQEPIIVRFLFGNIPGMPVNCDSILDDLLEFVPEDANMNVWVGAWRHNVSWNHSKIFAVDGKYLFNGGHNMWTRHYLKKDCVHDVSMEASGRVAHDGHLFANSQWAWVSKEHTSFFGSLLEMWPDNWPALVATRINLASWPEDAELAPPQYEKKFVPMVHPHPSDLPMVTMGRLGSLLYWKRPSDDAFCSMFRAAKKIIRMSLQDLGPPCLPTVKIAVPGSVWPKAYLSELGRAIYERGVDVEIALSNPFSIPDGLSPTEANYGNGWSCNDVACEIVKAIQKEFDEDDSQLRQMVVENLRLCYIRQARQKQWSDRMGRGNHAKLFFIDDIAYYVGSQNLYVCDLAEWGILIDDPNQTAKVMQEYWHPMWQNSFTGEDVDVHKVMDGLDVDRDGENIHWASADTKEKAAEAERASLKISNDHAHIDVEEDD